MVHPSYQMNQANQIWSILLRIDPVTKMFGYPAWALQSYNMEGKGSCPDPAGLKVKCSCSSSLHEAPEAHDPLVMMWKLAVLRMTCSSC